MEVGTFQKICHEKIKCVKIMKFCIGLTPLDYIEKSRITEQDALTKSRKRFMDPYAYIKIAVANNDVQGSTQLVRQAMTMTSLVF